MQKISWNDINDSDSSLESSSQEEIAQKVTSNEKSKPKQDLGSKLKNACDQYSLQKLEKHNSPSMWLYVTNSYNEKADEIHEFLHKSFFFSQVIRLKTIGWNVQTTSETGKKFIYQGLKGENYIIRFIYSKKNQQRQMRQQQKQKNTQLQKKVSYVQKGKQPVVQKFNTFTEQIKNNEFQQQEVYSLRNKGQKPKSKWVQKNSSSSSFNDLKRFQSPQTIKNIRDFKSPKRYIEKVSSAIEPKNTTLFIKTQEINFYEAQQSKNLYQPKKLLNQEMIVEKVKAKKVQEIVQQHEYRETSLEKKQEAKNEQINQSDQEIKLQKKKKNNKKRDGKAKIQQNKQESSNPFSYFSRF